jgi:hypothetical protein
MICDFERILNRRLYRMHGMSDSKVQEAIAFSVHYRGQARGKDSQSLR